MLEYFSSIITLQNIVSIVVILGFGYTIYHNYQKKKKIRPSMPSVEYINDTYGRRFLITVISNNPNGSELSKKPLDIEKLPRKKFRKKNILYLNYILNKNFLNPKIHYDNIPNWLLKGQDSFVAILADNQLAEKGTYKITFYTSDGSCSKTLEGYFGLLSQLYQRELEG